MDNYKDMYFMLFNKITDIIEELKEIQEKTEKMYIDKEEKCEEQRNIAVH